MTAQVRKPMPPTEPRPFTFDEAKLAVNNQTYQITDLNLYDTNGRIVWTVSVTILHAGKQTTGHAHELNDEVYEFVEGSGIMLLGKLAINVKAGDFLYVNKTIFHKVINISNASDLIFRCYFTGEIKRPHLK